ncbi:hypothetical protein Tco_1073171 [Tanacetum coccineum]
MIGVKSVHPATVLGPPSSIRQANGLVKEQTEAMEKNKARPEARAKIKKGASSNPRSKKQGKDGKILQLQSPQHKLHRPGETLDTEHEPAMHKDTKLGPKWEGHNEVTESTRQRSIQAQGPQWKAPSANLERPQPQKMLRA